MSASILTSKNKNYPIDAGTITFYRHGIFNAVGSDAAISYVGDSLSVDETITIRIDTQKIICRVDKVIQLNEQQYFLWVTGGRSNSNRPINAVHLTGPSLQRIAIELCQQTGNELDTGASDSDLLAKRFPSFSYDSTTSGFKQLSTLVIKYGGVCRFGTNGKLIIQRDNSPSSVVLPKSWIDLPPLNGTDEVEYGLDTLDYMPRCGQMHNGKLVETIRLKITRSTLRVTLGFCNYASTHNSISQFIAKSSSTYMATVVTQLPNWKLNVIFDDKSLSATNLTEVAIRYGSPLMSARVPVGTRVGVKFDDFGSPYVDNFTHAYGSQPLSGQESGTVFFGSPSASRGVARNSDGTITYIPQLWEAEILLPPLPAPGPATTGGTYNCYVKLKSPVTDVPTAIPLPTILPFSTPGLNKLSGLIVTSTNVLKTE